MSLLQLSRPRLFFSCSYIIIISFFSKHYILLFPINLLIFKNVVLYYTSLWLLCVCHLFNIRMFKKKKSQAQLNRGNQMFGKRSNYTLKKMLVAIFFPIHITGREKNIKTTGNIYGKKIIIEEGSER